VSYKQHRLIAQDSSFLLPKVLAKFQGGHPNGGAKFRWGRLKIKICNFRPVSCYISETVQDRDKVAMIC